MNEQLKNNEVKEANTSVKMINTNNNDKSTEKDVKLDMIKERVIQKDSRNWSYVNWPVSSSKSPTTPPPLQPESLRNIGANCYLNRAFQGISACDTFVKEITLLSEKYKSEDLNKLHVFKNLIDILNGCSKSQMEISRNPIFQQWNKCGQQDTYELLAYALNQVYNELRKYKEEKGEIQKRDLPMWLKERLPMRYTLLYAIECGCTMVTISPLQSDLALHLNTPKDGKNNKLKDLIDLYFGDDPIEDYECDKKGCNGKGAMRYARLRKPLPRTFCIHLERTYWNGYHMVKINSEVEFDSKLTIKSEFWSEKQRKIPKEDQNKLENTKSDKNEIDLIHKDKMIQAESKYKDEKLNKTSTILNKNYSDNNEKNQYLNEIINIDKAEKQNSESNLENSEVPSKLNENNTRNILKATESDKVVKDGRKHYEDLDAALSSAQSILYENNSENELKTQESDKGHNIEFLDYDDNNKQGMDDYKKKCINLERSFIGNNNENNSENLEADKVVIDEEQKYPDSEIKLESIPPLLSILDTNNSENESNNQDTVEKQYVEIHDNNIIEPSLLFKNIGENDGENLKLKKHLKDEEKSDQDKERTLDSNSLSESITDGNNIGSELETQDSNTGHNTGVLENYTKNESVNKDDEKEKNNEMSSLVKNIGENQDDNVESNKIVEDEGKSDQDKESRLDSNTSPELIMEGNNIENELETVEPEEDDESYDLVSVIQHLGSVDSGHYTCYKKVQNRWFLTNDSYISEVTEYEVLHCQAYVLFYEKTFDE